jgi:hypothetical protein
MGRYHPEFRTFEPSELGAALRFCEGQRRRLTADGKCRILIGAIADEG